MKRKAQTAEFKPPMQRFSRISRRNNRENASSGESAEIQPTDAKQISATVASSVQSAAPLEHSEEHQPQCSPQLDSDLIELNIKHSEGAGMEDRVKEDEDTSSPKQLTSYEAQLRRGSLDETGDNMLVNLEDVSGAIAVPAKACEEPEPESPKSPPKKRLRRRMGMCGLGERKRRLLIDGQHCMQSPTETKMADSAEATGKESGDVLKCIDDDSALLNNEGTTESVFLEQNHSSLQQIMTEGASSTEQDIQEIQAVPSEMALKIEESNLQECRTFHGMDMVSEASKVIAECLNDVEMQYGPTGHHMEEYPLEKEANSGCTDVTDEDSNNGSKDKDEHPVEVLEKQIFGFLGVTSESVTSDSSSVASDVVEGSTSIPVGVAEKMNYSSTGTHEVPEDSKVNAECLVEAEMHHGSTQEIHKGTTEKTNKDSTDVAEDVSHGTDTVTEVCEGSREPIEHVVDEPVIFGSTSVTAVFKDSTEQIEHPVDEGVISCSRSVTKVCEGSKNPTEYAGEVAEDGKYGSAAVTSDVCGSSIEVDKFPVADRGICGSTSVTEVCESSRKPTELTVQVTEEVTNGPIYFIKFCEGPKEWTEHPVELSELESYASTAVTNEVSEDSKETIGHPPQTTEEVSYASTAITVSEGSREQIENPDQLAKEESYGSTAVTNEVCEGSAKQVEHPVQLAEEVSYGSTAFTNAVYEGSAKPAEHPVQLDEEVSYGSTVVTNEVSEGSNEPAGHPVEIAEALTCGFICFTEVTEGSTETSKHPVEVAEEKSYSAVGVGLANKACESSEELTGHLVHMTKKAISTTSYVSEVSTKQTENPVHVAEEETCGEVSKELTNHLVQDSEGSLEPARCTVKISQEESYGCTVFSSEVSEGSAEWTGHPAQVPEEESYGSIAITNEVSRRFRELTKPSNKLVEDESCGSNTVPKEASEGSRESAEHAVQLSQDECCGSNTVPKETSEGSRESSEHLIQVEEDESYGSHTVPKEASEGSRESIEHSVQVDKDEKYGSNTFSKEASEGSRESTENSAQVIKDEICDSNTVPKEASEGSTEWTGHPPQVAKEKSYGSTAITNEVSKRFRESTNHSNKLAEDEICDSNTVPKEASEGSRESTKHTVQVNENEIYDSNTVPKETSEGSTEWTGHPAQVAEEQSYGSNTVPKKASEGSKELTDHSALLAEEESYGSTATITEKVHEGFHKVSMEVREALTALEDSEQWRDSGLDGNSLRAEPDPRRLQLNIQTNTDYGLTASTEAAFSEICETGSQFEHMELTQMPDTAVEGRSTDPGGKRSSSTEGLMGLQAPPTDQEEFSHDLLNQGICDLPVTSAIAKLQPICNPNMNLAFPEFSQDHNNIPSSLYSVTDSQLNSITLGMEMEDQPTLEGFVHQEDATELVCGLIKELSSLNCIVMAAHKEMEVLRRGNRPPKAPIRRSYGPRNSEI